MTLLVISPDYASHLLPLATLATAWQDAGERVVVASGPATGDDHRPSSASTAGTCDSAGDPTPG